MKKSDFSFRNPEIISFHFDVNHKFDLDNYSGTIKIQSETTIDMLEDDTAFVRLTVQVGDEIQVDPYVICVTAGAEFAWNKNITSEMVSLLLRTNAPAVLLSYIRPLVSMITSQSRYPAYNIPFLNMSDLKEVE